MGRQLKQWFLAVLALSLATPIVWILQSPQVSRNDLNNLVSADNRAIYHTGLRSPGSVGGISKGRNVSKASDGTSGVKMKSKNWKDHGETRSLLGSTNLRIVDGVLVDTNNQKPTKAKPIAWISIGAQKQTNSTAFPMQGPPLLNISGTTADPCTDRYVTKPSYTAPQDQKQRVLFMDGVGRLGNKMFQYAALLGIAKMHGFVPYVHKSDLLLNVFDVTHVTETKYKKFPIYFEKAAAAYDPCLETMRRDWDWRLGGYYQSWKYFNNAQDEVRKEFVFKHHVRNFVNRTMEHVKVKFIGQPRVGVHIRRGDMSGKGLAKKGYTTADKPYFLNAMNYFRQQLKNPVFVVVSDDINWSRRVLSSETDVFFTHGNREVDLATLASCDHSIISTGTYGWWGAWLAGGRTVYYRNFPKNGTWLATQYRHQDYFPPSWIGM